MKPIDLNLLPAQDWLTLRLDRLNTPYHAILAGEVDLDQMEAFCGAIRFTLFEFGANARRYPGRFAETVRVLITITDQVLEAAHEGRAGKPDQPKWTRVIDSITTHREQLRGRLQESTRAQKAIEINRKRETQRIAALASV